MRPCQGLEKAPVRRTCRSAITIERTTVPGHKSILAFGFIGSGDGIPAVAMLGRVSITVAYLCIVSDDPCSVSTLPCSSYSN